LFFQKKEVEEFLSFRWLHDEVPFNFDEIVVASNQVADKIREMPLAEFSHVWMLKDLMDLFMEWSIRVAEVFRERDEASPSCRSPY